MELAIDQQSKERGAFPQQPSRSDRLHQLMRGAPTTSGPAMIENPMRTTSKDDDVARARFPVRAPDADDADDSEVAEDADDREAEDHFPVPAAPGRKAITRTAPAPAPAQVPGAAPAPAPLPGRWE